MGVYVCDVHVKTSDEVHTYVGPHVRDSARTHWTAACTSPSEPVLQQAPRDSIYVPGRRVEEGSGLSACDSKKQDALSLPSVFREDISA